MGKEAKQIGGVVVGAASGTVGVLTGNPGMALRGSGMFLSSLGFLLFGDDREGNDPDTVSADPERYLPVVYGTDVVAGSYVDVREDSDDFEDVWVVTAFAHGSEDETGVDNIDTIYFESDKTEAWTSSGGVQSPPYSNNDNIFIVDTFLGSHSQLVDSNLDSEFTAWTDDHAGKGVAYAVFNLLWDDEVFSGIPEVHAEISGNHVYDPRDSTWKYSENPALIALDYLTSNKYGLGANYPERDSDGTDSEIHEQSWKDMADFCEDTVTVNFNDSTSTTQQRFKANGVIDTSRDPLRNLHSILTACRGEIVYQEGEFRLHIPRSKTATSYELDEDNIIGNWRFNRGGLEDTPNKVKAQYTRDTKDDKETSTVWPEPSATNTYLQNDNGYVNKRDIDLPFTKDETRAKQIAMVGLKEARQDLSVELTAKQSALQLQVGDVVPVTHETPGWNSKNFWVRAITYNPQDETVRLKLREYDANAYSLDAMDKAAGPPGTSIPDTKSVDAPTNFTVQSGASTALGSPDGVQVPEAFLTWDEPSQLRFLDVYEIEFKESADSTWKDVNEVQRGKGSYEGPVLTSGTEYDFRIRSRNVAGALSSWETPVGGSHTASASGVLQPVIQVDHDQVDLDAPAGNIDHGKLIATLFEPGGHDIDYEFFGKSGRGDSFSSIKSGTVSSGSTVDATYELSEKVNTYIKIVATSTNSNQSDSKVQAFDPDEIPDFQVFSADINSDGTVTVDVRGDADTQSGEVNISGDITNSPVTDTFSGNSASITTTDTVSSGGNVTITVTLYAGSTQTGTSTSESISKTRESGTSSALAPDVHANLDGASYNRAANKQVTILIDLEVVGTAHPDSSSPNIEVRLRETGESGVGAWSNWQSNNHVFDVDFQSRNPPKDVQIQARDTGVSGNPVSSIETWQQAIPNEGTTDPTGSDGGKVDEDVETAGGGGIFVKGAPGDADDATSIPLSGPGDVERELDYDYQNRMNTDADIERTTV